MTTGKAPVLPLFLRRLVLFPEASHVWHDDIHGALALTLNPQPISGTTRLHMATLSSLNTQLSTLNRSSDQAVG